MPYLKIVEFVLVAASLQSILFSFFLLIKYRKERLKQNLLLALFILFFSTVVLRGWYIGSEYYLENPTFLFLPLYITFALGPLFYLYVSYVLRSDFKFKCIHCLLFIPSFIQFIYHFNYFLKSSSERIYYFEHNYLNNVLAFEDLICIVSIFVYVFVAKKHLIAFNKRICINHSVPENELYKWINNLINVTIIALCVWTLLALIDLIIYKYQQPYSFYYPIYILIIIFSYWIIINGFIVTTKIIKKNDFDIKPDTFSLPDIELKKYLAALTVSMECDKLYLNPKLSLIDLANELEINPKYLSQILNQNLNINFRDYVNKYRVEMAKKELISNKNANFTITAISDKCGFNSKSTFNNVFKKHTNQTPTEYIRENRIS